MLSKKDKEAIRALIREELSDALTRTIQVERGPRQQGDPQEKRVVEEQWNLIDFIAGYIPYMEGAIRGMQEDVDKAKNTTTHAAGVLLQLEQSIHQIANVAEGLRAAGLLENPTTLMIEDASNESCT